MVFLIILILLLLFTAFILLYPITVKSAFYMDGTVMYVRASMLGPLILIKLELEDNRPLLTAYFLKLKVWKKALGEKREKGYAMDLVRSADLSDIHADAYYSLPSPFSTGMISGFIGAGLSMIEMEDVNLYPDFTSVDEFIRVEASVKIKIGNTISNFAENKKKRRMKNEWSKA